MGVTDSSTSASKIRRRIFFIVTNVISIIFLIWTLHAANLGELRHEVAHLDWRWVAAGIAFEILVYTSQAWRWILVLKPIKSVPIWDAMRSIFVGLFASAVVPLRAGEIIRCYLLAKWSGIPVSVTLASALIERIFDGIWLVLCLFITAEFMDLPGELVFAGYLLLALLVVCGILLGVAMFWKQQTLDYILGAKWLGWVHVLIEDLHLIGHSRYLYYSFLVSLPYGLIQALPIYALIRSYSHLGGLSFFTAFALMVIIRLGTILPQAPGNVGIYNGITVIGLKLFGVPLPVAKRFSIILWTAITIPLLIAGFVAVAITGVKMSEVHKSAQDQLRRREPVTEEDLPVS